jgi:hypothetical protein
VEDRLQARAQKKAVVGSRRCRVLSIKQKLRSAVDEPATCRRLARLMAELGWTTVWIRGLTRGGYLEQVRGNYREPFRD